MARKRCFKIPLHAGNHTVIGVEDWRMRGSVGRFFSSIEMHEGEDMFNSVRVL
jgi:hypothetical protein